MKRAAAFVPGSVSRANPFRIRKAYVVALVVAGGLAGAGCGSESSEQPALAEDIAAAPSESFFLGTEFDGLPLTAVVPPSEGAGGSTSFIYGDCEPPAGEGGCAPPLEVQSWLDCSRPRPASLDRLPVVKGAPVKPGSRGSGVEVYTGTSTVVIFASRVRAMAAVEELRAPDDDVPVTSFEPPAC